MMAKQSTYSSLNLPTQGVILLIVIVLLVAGAIGIPAIWLIRGQLDRQAWELTNQGSQMVKVLLDARINQINNLAILTAQRPTLSELLALDNPEKLASYLETLRVGAGLDLVMICNRQGGVVSQVGSGIPTQVCQNISSNSFYQPAEGTVIRGWLLAYQPILDKSTDLVVVGQALDRKYSNLLSEQIGMELLLMANGNLIGGSFPDNDYTWQTIVNQALISNNSISEIFTLDGIQFYAIRSNYGTTGLETMVLLPGSEIAETQQHLTRIAAMGILIVTLFCSLIGILLTRRISHPLERLRDSAITLRRGDLASPVSTNTKVKEIAEVTYALEDARIALWHTMEELRQEKAWADYLLEAVVEGIITIDRKGRITFFSKGAERITGCKQERVFGKAIDDIFLLANRESRFSQRIPSPGAKPEVVTILVNERPLTLTVSSARLTPPEVGKANLAVSIRDISNEEAMRGLLGDFLGNVTHEFRTPLTSLAVSIELLLDQLAELNQDEIRELLVSNHIGVLRLQNLIDNLLEGASIEAGRFRVSPHPTDLAEVIQEVVRMMLPLLERNHLQFQIDIPTDLPLVQADPRRTSQVLVNLLSNAIKWSPKGTEILLSATVTEDAIKIMVLDQGPGITLEHKKNLFTRFSHHQADNGRAEYGAGLGLSVVKAIVETQKGQVGVEDGPDGGAAFWFTIPIVELYPNDQEEP